MNITLLARTAAQTHRIAGLAIGVVIAAAVGGCGFVRPPSVWVENRSSQPVVFYVYDLGPGPAPYYIVPPSTSAHVGRQGLGTRAVQVNVLGWGHEANHVGPCSPGDYDDTIYDVPPSGSVRLLIDVNGQPSVSLAAEPESLPDLARAPLDGPLTEDELCQRVQELVAAQSTQSTAAPSAKNAAACRSFDGETVAAVGWSSASDFLAVSTGSDTDGQGRVRVFEWPGMDLVSEMATDAMAVDDVAIDGSGAVYWFTWDPMADPSTSRQLWKLPAGGHAARIGGPVGVGPYTGLIWAGGSLITTVSEAGPPERWRLVRLDIAHPGADPAAVTDWTTRAWSTFWADRSGEWIVWDEYDAAGEPQDFVILHDGQRTIVRPPGYGGRQMTLSPDRTFLIYQRSETARLTILNLKSGQITGELGPMESYGGEVSSAGILAALTAHGPGESNEVCTLDVREKLGSP